MATCVNPRAEDFERLAIRWADEPHDTRSQGLIATLALFPEQYMRNRDMLPQTDADRAFWLVCQASEILDGSIYSAKDDAQAEEMSVKATQLLDEALKLDPRCHDAVRMRHALETERHDDLATWLAEGAGDVAEACAAEARAAGMEPPDGAAGSSVYMRPYLRWLLMYANELLDCGRYKRSLEVCQTIMEADRFDVVGARLLAAYVYVKLEDAEGLAELIGRFGGEDNAWFSFARCAMAYKQRRFDDAAAILHELVHTYHLGAATLMNQEELPPALFGCHLQCASGSADELFVAISEAAIILDENGGDFSSPFSSWIAQDSVVSAEAQKDMG